MPFDKGVNKALWQTFLERARPVVDQWQVLFEQPESAQERTLQRLLKSNQNTAFGRAHDFSTIKDFKHFQDRVPVHSYTELQPWIERAQNEQGPIDAPLFFERTSGNSARQKHIPYTRAFLEELQQALTVWLADMHHRVPEIGDGRGYWSMSPPLQAPSCAANGIPVGSASDLEYLSGSSIAGLAGTLLIPELAQDAARWRRQTLLALLASSDLSFISVWSPTFLTSLLQPLFDTETADSRDTFTWLEKQLPQARSRVLRRARDQGVCTELWPRLAAVSCWMDGPSLGYAVQLAERFPQAQWLFKGLFATEGVVSVPFGAEAGCPLAVGSHCLEFLCEDGMVRNAHSLHIGETAQVLLTTGGGLYRYALGDRVKVVGMTGKTPRVEFVGRATSTCDLVGEKLDEATVETLLTGCIGPADSACLVPDAAATLPCYYLLLGASVHPDLQAMAHHIETGLLRSFHYAHARRLGQLGPLRVRLLNGGPDHLARVLEQAAEYSGIRAGDVKPRPLVSRLETARALMALTENEQCQRL